MRHAIAVLIFLVAILPLSGGMAGADEYDVTLDGLLGEMVDVARFSRLPAPWFTARQTSSYDRRSRTPDDPRGWFANGDAGHFQRVDDVGGQKRFVLVDTEGPGAVVRIWSANPKGTLCVEIDGEVVIEAPMADLLGGKIEPFGPGFAYVAARGFNLYFPLPYQKRCMIWSSEGGFYYHVGYRTYSAPTTVQPFCADLLKACTERMAQVGSRLTQLPDDSSVEGQTFRVTRTEPFRAETDVGAVAHLAFPSVIAAGREAELRRTLLSLRFDGVETVRVPLDAFLSLPAPVGTRWPMPYARSMEIGITGDGLDAIEGVVDISPLPFTARSVHFHAVWRSEYGIPTKAPRDWTFLDVEGEGVYVGNVLHVANPVRNWWGEGDEKIYVDDESFPSFFGTGTEDYYGYAWCSPELFRAAFHGQPRCDGPGNYGHTTVYRWHLADPIPFGERLRFDMEIWHHRRDVEVHYAAANVFFARPGARVVVPGSVTQARRPPPLPALEIFVIEGALEGEGLETWTGSGTVGPQDLAVFGENQWSRDAHLWWRGAKPNDAMNISFAAPMDGVYHVIAYLTKAPDYGRHRLFVNGRPTGEVPGRPVDLWAERVQPSGPLDLGAWTLKASGNELRVRVAGKNPRASGDGYMFGLDCLVLEPVASEPD